MLKPFVFLFLILVIGCSISGNTVLETVPMERNKGMNVYFCPRDDCEQVMIDIIQSSDEQVHCAFFDINLKGLINALGEKSKEVDVKLVVDDENYGDIIGPNVRKDTSSQFSHNKFCVVDDKLVVTGSMNPTENGANKNNNNVIVFYSNYLAKNYEDEFKELWDGEFGSGDKVKYREISLNGNRIENYFCPEDDCASRIAKELRTAEKSIYFMAFSFTNEEIADGILFNDRADIRGLFEKRGSGSSYSQYSRLRDFGLDVRLDNNPATMHHKVFVIDNRTVITGSMNPTGAGDRKNDENVLIVHDEDLAMRYVEEFLVLYYSPAI